MKLKIIKLKMLAQQAMIFYGLLINGPMIAYIFWKTSEIKWLAAICLAIGFIAITSITIIWYKYFLPAELEFNSRLNPEWNALRQQR